MVLAALLKRFPHQIRIEDVSTRLPKPAPAITNFDGHELPDQVRHALRLWPHHLGTAGFFAARLTKLDSISEASRGSWRIPPADISLRPILRKDKHRILQFINDLYGIAMDEILGISSLEVALIKEQYYLVPGKLDVTFSKLPVISTGLPLGKPFKEGLQISHEFVSRFGDQFKNGVLLLEDESIPSWLRGEDIRGYQSKGAPLGEIYAVRDRFGRNLGRGKLSAERLKNMLPTRLF